MEESEFRHWEKRHKRNWIRVKISFWAMAILGALLILSL